MKYLLQRVARKPNENTFLTSIYTDKYFFLSFFLVSLSESSVSVPTSDTTGVSTAGVAAVAPEAAALVLMEGVVKGGYPVDMSSQSTMDLTSIGSSDCGCTDVLVESGLESAAVAQLEVGYSVLDTQEPYNKELDFPPSITEVIRPMEMAELVDILPTLSLIEEENPTDSTTTSVMEMLESFALGIGEDRSLFDFGSSDLMSGLDPSPHSNNSSSVNETRSESMMLQEQEVLTSCSTEKAAGGDLPALSLDSPREDTETQEPPSKGACPVVRSQVEWDKPSNSAS